MRLHHLIHDDDLLEAASNKAQGASLVRAQIQGRLDVVAAITEIGDKVDLEALAVGRAVNNASARHLTDVDREAPKAQFVEDDILHDAVLLDLPEAEASIAQPHVFEVVLLGRPDLLAVLYVIAGRPGHDESVLQITDELLDSFGIQAGIQRGLERRLDSGQVGQGSDGGR